MEEGTDKEGSPNKSQEKSAGIDRGTGMRRQKHRRWRVDPGGGKLGQQGETREGRQTGRGLMSA